MQINDILLIVISSISVIQSYWLIELKNENKALSDKLAISEKRQTKYFEMVVRLLFCLNKNKIISIWKTIHQK